MDGQTGVWLLTVLLSVALNSAEAQNRLSYFEVGGELHLRPDPVCRDIFYMVWKHNGNLKAELQEGEIDFYRGFHDNLSLNSNTGELEIRNMTKADSGLYTVEINNSQQRYGYDAVVIHRVLKPEVTVRPVSCSPTSSSCLLSCDGNPEEAGPVTFYWKKGVGEWKQGDRDMTIINNEETQTVPVFSCQIKSPDSERESELQLNPFFQQKADPALWSLVLGAVMRVLAMLALVVAVVYLVWLNRKIACQCKCGKDNAM